MIALPPSLAGAVKVTVACALPAVAVPMVGAPGAVAGAVGVTTFDGADGGPVPMLFVAVTVKVYALPFASPVTVIDVHGALQLPVMDSRRRRCGEARDRAATVAHRRVKLTVACASPAVAVPMVGAPGAVAGAVGVTVFDAADCGPVPTLLLAVTVNV
jgi:hypothetical protein